MRVHATDRRNATGAPWMAVATALRLAALVATLNASGTTAGGSRRVSWFTSGGAWPIGTDGLNLSQWITAHRGAITGTMPCCGCWAALNNGTFVNTGRCSSKTGYTPDGDPVRAAVHRANWAAAANAGVTLEPTGGFSVGFILNGSWMQPGSLDSLVQMLQTEGWDGIGVDNEDYPPTMPPELPAQFANLLGNLSSALAKANRTLVVDITSTWNSDIGGPQYIPGYRERTPSHTRYMDMAEYFAGGHIPGGNKAQLAALAKMLPLKMAVPGVGMPETPGHENASCGWDPPCTNASDPKCKCLNYGWNETMFTQFVADVEAAGMEEIAVWREDMTPPSGTTPSIPDWFINALADFVGRGANVLSAPTAVVHRLSQP